MTKDGNLMQRVEYALLNSVYVRDSDHKLVAWIWDNEMDNTISGDVIQLLNTNQLTSWESITRCRRKLQAEKKDLRGKTWDERHDKSVKVGMKMTEYEPTL